MYLSITNWDASTALSDRNVFKLYLITFYTEFGIASLGAFVLIKIKKKDFVAPWIALIVGAIFSL